MSKVLIVEDNKLLARVCQHHFSIAGFDTLIAADGQEALDFLKAERPDLMILDLMLPKVSGLEVLQQVRSQPAIANLPVIVATNAYLTTLLDAAKKAGANQCVIKSDCPPKAIVDMAIKLLAQPAQETSGHSPTPQLKLAAEPERPGHGHPRKLKDIASEAYIFNELPSGATRNVVTSPPGAAKPPSIPMLPASGAVSRSTTSAPVPGAKATKSGSAKPPPPVEPTMDRTFLETFFDRSVSVSDAGFVADIRRQFLADGPALARNLAALGQNLGLSGNDQQRISILRDLYRKMRALTGNAVMTEVAPIARLAAALEALLKEIHAQPEHVRDSEMRTLGQAFGLLETMFTYAAQFNITKEIHTRVLVIDPDPANREAIGAMLKIAHMQLDMAENPIMALIHLQKHAYDLAILNTRINDTGGMDLANQMRALPVHRHTPIIFVTELADFSPAKFNGLDPVDMVAQPFLPVEFAVKALTNILKSQCERCCLPEKS